MNMLLLEKLLGFAKKYGLPTVFALSLLAALFGFNKQVVAEREAVLVERREVRDEQREERQQFIQAIERNTSAIQELTVAVTRLEGMHEGRQRSLGK